MAATLDAPVVPASPARYASPVVEGVSWETYKRLRDEAGPETRITYDDGRMQIMPPVSDGHGSRMGLLRRLAVDYFEAVKIDFEDHDVVTLVGERVQKGCEGDQAFYVRAEPPPPGTEELNLAVHNPPDLVIEVDITSSSIPKEPIYAAIGVAELWRLDGDDLSVRRLHLVRAEYEISTKSGLLPDLDVAALADHVRLGRTVRQGEVAARWRAFLAR